MRPLIKKVLREYWEQEPDKWDLLADDLKDCLEECISNQDQIDELITFIKSKRSVKEYLDIKKI